MANKSSPQSEHVQFPFSDVYPDKTHPCNGKCGGHVYEIFSWKYDGKFYCGDCFEKLIDALEKQKT
jgi:hypothetical protein